MRVGLLTCLELPEPDMDALPLARAFAGRGHEVTSIAWDDPTIGPDAGGLPTMDALLIRSTWNYHRHAEAFASWIRWAGSHTRLVNPPEVVLWNMHKRYLVELAGAGVPVVPTVVIPRGTPGGDIDPGVAGVAPGGLVVKPAIGAGSRDTRRFVPEDRDGAIAFASALAAHEDVLVQPALAGFDEPGERCLIWIDGVWTHAIRKRPRYAGDTESVEASDPARAEERAIGEAAMRLAPASPAYARLDLVPDERGDPVVSELELIEPSLFVPFGEGAAERYVDMAERLGAG